MRFVDKIGDEFIKTKQIKENKENLARYGSKRSQSDRRAARKMTEVQRGDSEKEKKEMVRILLFVVSSAAILHSASQMETSQQSNGGRPVQS